MDSLQLLIDLHSPNARLGPGSDQHTTQALQLSGLLNRNNLNIADLGCGTGASTLVLAQALNAHITAVDLFPAFLHELKQRAKMLPLRAHITTLEASIDALPFSENSLDAIWSEGAIYNLGFQNGLNTWRPFLKPNGILAVSEITWTTQHRPTPLQEHWQREYPEIDTASNKISLLEQHGFTPIGYFTLPPSCWLRHYYRPLQTRFPIFLQQHNHSEAARTLIQAEQHEIELYETYKDYVSYGFYIARKNI